MAGVDEGPYEVSDWLSGHRHRWEPHGPAEGCPINTAACDHVCARVQGDSEIEFEFADLVATQSKACTVVASLC
jgi:hypothetical protein